MSVGQRFGLHLNLFMINNTALLTFNEESQSHLIQTDKKSTSLSKLVNMAHLTGWF